jgi:glutamate synthase (NADPH/NADH) small chain
VFAFLALEANVVQTSPKVLKADAGIALASFGRRGMIERKDKIPPEERTSSFLDLYAPFTEQEAMVEASKCLSCTPAPCIEACPTEIPIPIFIRRIKWGDYEGAARVIREANALPDSCGRLCPPMSTCISRCIAEDPVNIAALQSFALEEERKRGYKVEPVEATGPRVAVVGGGPAGLACAARLAERGYRVTVFEATSHLGGIVTLEVPRYKITVEKAMEEIQYILDLGVEVRYNTALGKDITLDELEQEYDAVFLGIGADEPIIPNVPGRELKGVYNALELLRISNLDLESMPDLGKRVVIIGGGNTSSDIARTCVRLDTERVTIVYRRSFHEMPMWGDEKEACIEEGVEFMQLTAPVEILGDEEGRVRGIRCVQMMLGDLDETGRRRPIPIEGTEFEMPCDSVIFAVGQKPSELLPTLGLEMQNGRIQVDTNTFQTSRPKVFAGGDLIGSEATVVQAVADGQRAALAIHDYLSRKKVGG